MSLDEAEVVAVRQIGTNLMPTVNELIQIRIRKGLLISKREHDEIVAEKNQAIDRLNSWSYRGARLWGRPWFRVVTWVTAVLGVIVGIAPMLWLLRKWFLWWFPVP